jgi:hypothetical protein
MALTLDIPDPAAAVLTASAGKDPARALLEAYALEGYRAERLSEYQVQQLLGIEYFEEVHRFFNEHGVYPPYSMEDLERDTAAALEVARSARKETRSDELR